MQAGFPLPPDEARRLERLRSTGLLDSGADAAFDRITRLAARLLGVPIALVSLIDADRQWFKSRVGLDAPETPREQAFCAHTICGDGILEVEDAMRDDRFAANPLVTGAPNIRFYAGAPLVTDDGLKLGTLCAIDRVPRRLSEDDRTLLSDLAGIVADQIRLSDFARRARDAESRLADAVEALPDGFVLYDADDRLVMCNSRYREIYRLSTEAIHPGMRFEDILREGLARGQYADAVGREEAWLAARLAAHADPPAEPIEQEIDGGRWLRIHESRTGDGGLVGFRVDVTALKRTQQELALLAWTDSLTGALNRHRFMELAEIELARADREGRPLSLLLIDVDRFKSINDTHGHAAGDAVLATLTRRWREALRGHDLIGRLGGDEFVVLLPGPDAIDAEVVAERLVRVTTAAPVPFGDLAISAAVSVGIADLTGEVAGLADLFALADAALYAAKAAGRGRIVAADRPEPRLETRAGPQPGPRV